MNTLIQEKTTQAIEILKEYENDIWLTFVRETTANRDPILDLIYGHNLTWQSALILSRTGERIAIIGHFEAETARQAGAYTEVIPYHEGIRQPLQEVLAKLNPSSIAINYSANDVLADGLSHGMHILLGEFLDRTPWKERLISSEKLMRALRGRKTMQEIERIRTAIAITRDIYDHTFKVLEPGMSEKQVASFMHKQLRERGLEPAWDTNHCPTVNAGPDSPVGHVEPTDLEISSGQIVHFDFGVKYQGYCSDIQRVVYMLTKGEKSPPREVLDGFKTIANAIQITAGKMKPGMRGFEIDAICREIITNAGFPEYKYATGHQVGMLAHDGAGILGPRWERYGETPEYLVEPGQVYTLEPGLQVPGYGYIGLEEMVLVTSSGSEFLTQPQTEVLAI